MLFSVPAIINSPLMAVSWAGWQVFSCCCAERVPPLSRVSDCLDGGDEINCGGREAGATNLTCKHTEFACRERPFCVDNSWLCDGDKVSPSAPQTEYHDLLTAGLSWRERRDQRGLSGRDWKEGEGGGGEVCCQGGGGGGGEGGE